LLALNLDFLVSAFALVSCMYLGAIVVAFCSLARCACDAYEADEFQQRHMSRDACGAVRCVEHGEMPVVVRSCCASAEANRLYVNLPVV
jgi:hypothetical protein